MISTLENDPAGRTAAPVTLGQIELHCSVFNTEADILEGMVSALERDLEAVKQKHMHLLKKQASKVARAEADLHSLIERSADLFKKPRTLTLHGVKVGFTSAEGKLIWDCADEVLIGRIKKLFLGDAGEYIDTKEVPRKDELKRLPSVEFAKLGLELQGAGDQVVLKRESSDVAKLMDKLLKNLVEALVETK